MPSPGSVLRQLSSRQTTKSPSKRRWVGTNNSFNHTYTNSNFNYNYNYSGGETNDAYNGQANHWGQTQINGYSSYDSHGSYYNNNTNAAGFSSNVRGVVKKRVMVVVDRTSRAKHAVMWALNQVVNDGDMLTLLHIISNDGGGGSSSSDVARSLGSLCKAYKPQVEVEALVIQGPRLATVLSQVKKLEVSVLVLGQKKPSTFINCLFGSSSSSSSSDDFVDQCINSAECLTVGVRKQSSGMGGYLISTRSQKNFWLLA